MTRHPSPRQKITVDVETPASCSGSGPSYNLTYATNPTGVQVGDFVIVDKREAGEGGDSSILSTYTYQVTAIDTPPHPDEYTLKYITDDESLGDDSPCDLPAGTGSSGSPDTAPNTFKRDLGAAFLAFVE